MEHTQLMQQLNLHGYQCFFAFQQNCLQTLQAYSQHSPLPSPPETSTELGSESGKFQIREDATHHPHHHPIPNFAGSSQPSPDGAQSGSQHGAGSFAMWQQYQGLIQWWWKTYQSYIQQVAHTGMSTAMPAYPQMPEGMQAPHLFPQPGGGAQAAPCFGKMEQSGQLQMTPSSEYRLPEFNH